MTFCMPLQRNSYPPIPLGKIALSRTTTRFPMIPKASSLGSMPKTEVPSRLHSFSQDSINSLFMDTSLARRYAYGRRLQKLDAYG